MPADEKKEMLQAGAGRVDLQGETRRAQTDSHVGSEKAEFLETEQRCLPGG